MLEHVVYETDWEMKMTGKDNGSRFAKVRPLQKVLKLKRSCTLAYWDNKQSGKRRKFGPRNRPGLLSLVIQTGPLAFNYS